VIFILNWLKRLFKKKKKTISFAEASLIADTHLKLFIGGNYDRKPESEPEQKRSISQ
jgi:hypothetical protein